MYLTFLSRCFHRRAPRPGYAGALSLLLMLCAAGSSMAQAIPETAGAAKVTTVTYVDATVLRNNQNNKYFSSLLELALKKSEVKYGPYQLYATDTLISQSRQLRELNKGTIDVFWTMTTEAREAEARPIRIPLTKGMYGIRVLAINPQDKDRFAAIKQSSELAELPALMGADWPDTRVLRFNHFQVNTELPEQDLYHFIARNTGYYFPRAVTEAWAEQESLPNKNVLIDDSQLLLYPAVMYFFVARDNEKLAQRLEYGLRQAMADGDFDQLFFNFWLHKKAFELANFQHRTIHRLDNPFLPLSAPVAQIKLMQQSIISGNYGH